MHHVLAHFQNIARGCIMNTLPAGLQAICWKRLCKYMLFLLFMWGKAGVVERTCVFMRGSQSTTGPNLAGVAGGLQCELFINYGCLMSAR